MSENIKQEDLEKKPLPSEGDEAEKKAGDENEAKGLNRDGSPKQDPLKQELEKVQKQTTKTKKEKLEYSKRRIEKQLEELGGEEGDEPILEDGEKEDDDKPVTVGMLRQRDAQAATKTALQLADEIADEAERELTRFHLENTIRPTGDPKKDLELAQVHVNDVKNRQIIEQMNHKPEATKIVTDGGHNPNDGKIEAELTADELPFTRPPFNMSKELIISKRIKS